MNRFEKHIFICENKRPDGHAKGNCFDKGGAEIKALFKKRLAELGINKKVRANSAGCLGICKAGPVVVIYPEQVWYSKVKLEDVEEIIQSHIINNKPVERLLLDQDA